VPLSSISGRAVQPGWLVPSRITGFVICGSCEPMAMLAGPAMLKWMMFVCPVVVLFWLMAQRNEPVLVLSVVFVTTKVAGTTRGSSGSRRGRRPAGQRGRRLRLFDLLSNERAFVRLRHQGRNMRRISMVVGRTGCDHEEARSSTKLEALTPSRDYWNKRGV